MAQETDKRYYTYRGDANISMMVLPDGKKKENWMSWNVEQKRYLILIMSGTYNLFPQLVNINLLITQRTMKKMIKKFFFQYFATKFALSEMGLFIEVVVGYVIKKLPEKTGIH